MRVFNEDKTIELTEYDLDLGHLENDTLVTHIEAVEEVPEQGHYVTLAEYPETGGKEVEWIVDVPKVEAVEEHDETEDILVYIPFTESELKQISLRSELEELETWLNDHDYIGTKIATGRATIEDYAEEIELMKIKAQRIDEIRLELGDGN